MQKVLFFDDEPFVIGYLVQNLQDNFGWVKDKEIKLVSSFVDLLHEINNNDETYSLFVLDVMVPMPSDELRKQFTQQELDEMHNGMSTGLVMAKKIRQIERYAKVPILYLSARIIPNIPDSEKNYTFYIRKPVSTEEISKKMDELLAN